MTLEVKAKGKSFVIEYDEDYLNTLLTEIGIAKSKYYGYTKKAILYYTTESFNMKEIYTLLGKEEGYESVTQQARIAKSIEQAVYNGMLKYISDHIHGVRYDYVYGFTNKQLIALIAEHLKEKKKVIVTVTDLAEETNPVLS